LSAVQQRIRRKTMYNIIRVLGAVAMALGAAQAAILAYPGDLVAQDTLVLIGAVNAGLAAMVAYLAKPESA
jgi:hypothetical protein